jgi:hypothetical protein
MKLNLSPLCLIFYRSDLGLDKDNNKPILGLAKGPIVWILESSKNDKGVLAHELEHVRQAWRGLIIFHALLLFIPAYDKWCEKKAMEAQLQNT